MASTMGASSPLLLLPSAAVRKPTVVALGNFDGVHRGHQALLAEAVALAKELGATPYALTFDPHPATSTVRDPRRSATSTHRETTTSSCETVNTPS